MAWHTACWTWAGYSYKLPFESQSGMIIWSKITTVHALRWVSQTETEFDGVLFNLQPLATFANSGAWMSSRMDFVRIKDIICSWKVCLSMQDHTWTWGWADWGDLKAGLARVDTYAHPGAVGLSGCLMWYTNSVLHVKFHRKLNFIKEAKKLQILPCNSYNCSSNIYYKLSCVINCLINC